MDEKTPDKIAERLKELKKGAPAAAPAARAPAARPKAMARPKGPAVAAHCLPRTNLRNAHSRAREILANRGSTAVLFRGRSAILVTYDFPRSMKISVPSGHRVFSGPQQLAVVRNTAKDPGPEFIEVLSTTWGYRACP